MKFNSYVKINPAFAFNKKTRGFYSKFCNLTNSFTIQEYSFEVLMCINTYYIVELRSKYAISPELMVNELLEYSEHLSILENYTVVKMDYRMENNFILAMTKLIRSNKPIYFLGDGRFLVHESDYQMMYSNFCLEDDVNPIFLRK